jgi:putative hydrolase of the HAD superfamily
MKPYKHYIFDWGDTLMVDLPGQVGPMCHWPEIKIVEGAAKCLAELSKVAKCYIATNAKNSNAVEIRKTFERAELSQFIEHIFCADTIGFSKPQAEYFRFIIEALDAPTSDILMVGDSLEKDISGARNVGIQAIWFNPGKLSVSSDVTAINQLIELVDYSEPLQ